MIEIEVNGVTELLTDLRQFPDKLQGKVIGRMSQVAYDSAQRGAGRHTKTGALFQSLYNRQITNGRQVGHDPKRAPHAKFVQFGYRRHWVAPTKKKALRWVDGNGYAFSKGHWVGPYAGDPYMIRAKDDALAKFSAILDKAMQESI